MIVLPIVFLVPQNYQTLFVLLPLMGLIHQRKYWERSRLTFLSFPNTPARDRGRILLQHR